MGDLVHHISAMHLLLFFILLRIISVFVINTWFVADEYWQALEISHNWIYGYGYETWEWHEGLRSVVFPASFAAVYKILAVLHIDTVTTLTVAPRILCAVISAVGDYTAVKLAVKLYGAASRPSVVLCLSSNWFLEYCASRTLSAVPETTATLLALLQYPWALQQDSNTGYMWWVGLGCTLRPTTAVLFVPLLSWHCYKSRRRVALAVTVLLQTVIVLGAVCVMDSVYYGRFTLVPWNFLKFNLLSPLADHYGRHPWHWYAWSGVPSMLGPHALLLLAAVWRSPRRYTQLLLPCAATLAVYSCVGHKEVRLLLPLLPLLLIIAGDGLAQFTSARSKSTDTSPSVSWWWGVVACVLVLPSVALLVFFGVYHQQGPLALMPVLRQLTQSSEHPALLFLTPCHSTPLYSHLHRNMPVRFLTCEPNFERLTDYIDEADRFYTDPPAWLAIHAHKSLRRINRKDGRAERSSGNNCLDITECSGSHSEIEISKNRCKQEKSSDTNYLDNTPTNGDKILKFHKDPEVDDVLGNCLIKANDEDQEINIQRKLSESDAYEDQNDLENDQIISASDRYMCLNEETCSFDWDEAASRYQYDVMDALVILPTHVIIFDTLEQDVSPWLQQYHYNLCAQVFHTHITEGYRGNYFMVYCLPES